MIRWSMQLLCLLLIVGAGLTWLSLRSAQPRTTPITLDELKQCAELVTLQVPVQQLAEAHVRGYTGGIRCLVLAYGQAWIATDLDQARLETDDHGVTLYLMQPRIIACTLVTAALTLWLLLTPQPYAKMLHLLGPLVLPAPAG